MSESKDMYSVIKQHLKTIGADGLCGECCGCDIDDLCCCESNKVLSCVPAIKKKCSPDCQLDCKTGYKEGNTCYQPMQTATKSKEAGEA